VPGRAGHEKTEIALPLKTILPALLHAAIVRDRRGITAMTFAIMAFVLLGFVGFSTEVGGWFLARTGAQAAADGAAVAAAMTLNAALNAGSDTTSAQALAQTAASDALALNMPSAASYTINVSFGTNDLTNPATPTATVLVSFQIPPLISAIFTGTSNINFNVEAAAGMQQLGTACVLSTIGDLAVEQLPPSDAPSACSYVSNATDANAINVTASSGGPVYAFVTAGDCPNCPAPSPGFGRPTSAFQPTVPDPYQATLAALLSGIAGELPASSSDPVYCLPDPSTTGNLLVPANGVPNGNPAYAALSASGQYQSVPGKLYAYCSNLANVVLSSNTTMAPGVYIFSGATLTVKDNVTLSCSTGSGDCYPATGVTVIFTGAPVATGDPTAVCSGSPPATDPPPTLKICAGANVNIQPAAAGDLPQEFASVANFANFGVLFWRDANLSNSQPGSIGNPAVDIQVNPNGSVTAIGLTGLLYFPGAVASYGGTAQSNTCVTLLAGTISLVTNPSQFSDCSYIYTTPQVFAVRISE